MKTWTQSLGGEADNTGDGAVCLTSHMSCIKKQTRVNAVHSADWIFNYRTGVVTHLMMYYYLYYSITERRSEEINYSHVQSVWIHVSGLCLMPAMAVTFNIGFSSLQT